MARDPPPGAIGLNHDPSAGPATAGLATGHDELSGHGSHEDGRCRKPESFPKLARHCDTYKIANKLLRKALRELFVETMSIMCPIQ